MNLGKLFDKYGSDKAHNGHAHHYHDDYERLVPRDTKVLVELGLGSHIGFDGSFGSPRAWLEWLDGGEYIGVDIVEPPAEIMEHPNFTFVKCDLSVREEVEGLAEIIEGCDVVIDDASHVAEHQRLCFGLLFPSVKPGGVYIVEDLYIHGSAIDMRDCPFCEEVVGKGLAAVMRKPLEKSSHKLR